MRLSGDVSFYECKITKQIFAIIIQRSEDIKVGDHAVYICNLAVLNLLRGSDD
jgi:hypothetical protein